MEKKLRTIKKIVTGQRTRDGAGVSLVRVIGNRDVEDFDPFLMLDAFDSTNPEDYIKGFPWHPHRGIETVTYLIQGDIEHGDSLGNKGSILDGDCQWMTAGSGIIHQEMPKASDRMLGAQLWVNLPAANKMTVPKYRDIPKDTIPVVEEGGNRIHIICGEYKSRKGAIEGDYVKPVYLDVEVEPGATWIYDTEEEYTLFVYIVAGAGAFNADGDEVTEEKHAILFTSGSAMKVTASSRGARFLLFSGKPLKEPVAWGGPIVMNTREELHQAFKELEDNTFIK